MQTIPYPTEWKNYYVETPQGADYTTCPLCNGSCYCCGQDAETAEQCSVDEVAGQVEDMHYCGNCCILFGIGCCYSCQGCTDDIWYGKFVESFKYKGVLYEGQPKFLTDQVERKLSMGNFQYKRQIKIPRDFKEVLSHMEDIKYKCTCFMTGCKTNRAAYYPYESHPQYYKCSCKVRLPKS